jgi:hypothetical protein
MDGRKEVQWAKPYHTADQNSNGAKEKLSGCHQSPQPLDSFFVLVKYILVKDDFF